MQKVSDVNIFQIRKIHDATEKGRQNKQTLKPSSETSVETAALFNFMKTTDHHFVRTDRHFGLDSLSTGVTPFNTPSFCEEL